MEGKKKYFALVLFLFIGLMIFTFANPADETKEFKDGESQTEFKENSSDKDNKKDKEKDAEEEKTEGQEQTENNNIVNQNTQTQNRVDNTLDRAKAAVELAEGSYAQTDVDAAKQLVNNVTDTTEKGNLQDRLEEVENGIKAKELLEQLEKQVEEAENKNDIKDSKDFRDEKEIADKIAALTNNTVKEELTKRLSEVNEIIEDTTAPKVNITPNQASKENLTITLDESENEEDVTIYLSKDGSDEEVIANNTATTENGIYTLRVVDKAFNEDTIRFVVDSVEPKFEGLTYGGHYSKIKIDVVDLSLNKITVFNQDTGKTDEVENKKELTEDATYLITAYDEAENKKEIWVAIDTTEPTITGTEVNSNTQGPVTLEIFDKYLANVTVDKDGTETEYVRNDFTVGAHNKNWSYNPTFTEEGVYTVTATDQIGLTKSITFIIDTTEPTYNFGNGATYGDFPVEVTDKYFSYMNVYSYATKKTKKITTNTWRMNSGNCMYRITAYDIAGNKKEIWIYHDDSKPTIEGEFYQFDTTAEFKNNSVYQKANIKVTDADLKSVVIKNSQNQEVTSVTYKWEDKNKEFTYLLNTNEVYTITATDRAKNSDTWTVEIDNTPSQKWVVNYNVNTHKNDDKVQHATNGNNIRANIWMNEELSSNPTFTFYSNGKEIAVIEKEQVKTRATGNTDFPYEYYVVLNIDETLVAEDGDLTYKVTNIYDRVGNKTEDITNVSNGKVIKLDRTPATRVYSTIAEANGKTFEEKDGVKYYYMKNGDSFTFRMEFTEKLSKTPSLTIGGQTVTLVLNEKELEKNGKVIYQGEFKIAENESTMTEGSLEIKLSEVYDLAGNKTTAKKILNQTTTSNNRTAIYDRTPSTIVAGGIQSPKGEATQVQTFDITITEAYGIDQIKFAFDKTADFDAQKIVEKLANVNPVDSENIKDNGDGTYTITVTTPYKNSSKKLLIAVTDKAGNLATYESPKYYRIDSTLKVNKVELVHATNNGPYKVRVEADEKVTVTNNFTGDKDNKVFEKVVEITTESQEIEFTVTDVAGNTQDYKITVPSYDETLSFTLKGDKEIMFFYHETFNEENYGYEVSAFEQEVTDITVTTEKVQTKKGYNLVYTATDKYGNTRTDSRTVTVLNEQDTEKFIKNQVDIALNSEYQSDITRAKDYISRLKDEETYKAEQLKQLTDLEHKLLVASLKKTAEDRVRAYKGSGYNKDYQPAIDAIEALAKEDAEAAKVVKADLDKFIADWDNAKNKVGIYLNSTYYDPDYINAENAINAMYDGIPKNKLMKQIVDFKEELDAKALREAAKGRINNYEGSGYSDDKTLAENAILAAREKDRPALQKLLDEAIARMENATKAVDKYLADKTDDNKEKALNTVNKVRKGLFKNKLLNKLGQTELLQSSTPNKDGVIDVKYDTQANDISFYNKPTTVPITINGNNKVIESTITSEEFEWLEGGTYASKSVVFSSTNGSPVEINNLTFKGAYQTIFLGHKNGQNTKVYANGLNIVGVEVFDLVVNVAPAVSVYGDATITNSNIYGTKLSALETAKPQVCDMTIASGAKATLASSKVGSILMWKEGHLVVEAGTTVDSVEMVQTGKPSGLTTGSVTVKEGGKINKVIVGDKTYTYEEWLVIYNSIAVKTAKELKNAFSDLSKLNGKPIYLTADIDMNGQNWKPIELPTGFDFKFYGNNHTISNLTVTTENETGTGAFISRVDTGKVEFHDLTLNNLTINSTKTETGGFIGYAGTYQSILIDNCHIKNSNISGPDQVGGFIGWSEGPHTNEEVDGTATVTNSSIENTTLTSVEGSVGGVIGHNGANTSGKLVVNKFTAKNNNFTGEKDAKVGVVVGTVNIGKATINNVTSSGNELNSKKSERVYGRLVDGTLTVNGDAKPNGNNPEIQ